MRCCCSTDTSKLPTRTMDPSARMLSLPRLNSPDAMYPFMMLTPSFWSKEMPATSSKHTTSYWQTRPRCPFAMLTNIFATVALPPESRWECGESCW